MKDYPEAITEKNHIESAPRRVRAMIGGRTVVDTTRALYVWEWPYYPQYYIPLADVDQTALVDERETEQHGAGTASMHALEVGDTRVARAARVFGTDAIEGLDGFVRFEWDAFDAWFEEDEEIFVHPRSPYTRVDALRSGRTVRVELDGVLLAESTSTVMVFETGLPTRYYFPRTDVELDALTAVDTISECPYKGTTSGYWSVTTPVATYDDLAWAYDFPTRQLLPITGLIAFYNEKVDITVDGEPLEAPVTHFA